MCVAFSNKQVTYNSVIEAIGLTDRETLKSITNSLLNRNEGELLSTIDKVAKKGKNMTQLSKDLIGFVRDLLVVKTAKDYESILKLPKSELKDLEDLKDLASNDKLVEILTRLSSLDNEFRFTQNPRALVEITLLSLCNFEVCEINEVKTKLKQLELKLK